MELMEQQIKKNDSIVKNEASAQEVKIVAEMPGDKEMQANLEDMKKNDGYPGSCGGL